jgi:hypothetical protein
MIAVALYGFHGAKARYEHAAASWFATEQNVSTSRLNAESPLPAPPPPT